MTIDRPPGPAGILRLMQLSSPTMPIGAYAYSQGLEYAVEAGWVENESSASDWILGLMKHALGRWEAPVLARVYRGWELNDEETVQFWNDCLYASRESIELQAEDRQLGNALARLLADLGIAQAAPWANNKRACFSSLFALAAVRWRIPLNYATCGYLWTWAENQVAAAIKLVPLGQTAGQRILSASAVEIPDIVRSSLNFKDEEIGFATPARAMAGALHETQYTRLFRS